MIAGIVWALIGLAACEITNRGKVTTTVVTAAAGALGIGARAAHDAPSNSGVYVIVGLGAVALVMLAFLALTLAGGRGPRRHGSAAIASTRKVLYHEGRDRPIHQGMPRPDRTRGELR